LSNEDLHQGASELTGEERGLLLGLLFYLDEIDQRGDFGEHRSLWDYCVLGLGIPSAQTWLRTNAMRLIREYPQAIERLRDGRLNLSNLVALRKALTPKRADRLFREVEGKTKKEAAAIAAMTIERVAAKSSIKPVKPRVLPVPLPIVELRLEDEGANEPIPAGEPLPESYLVMGVEDVRDLEPISATQCQLTITAPIQFMRDLEELSQLLSHRVPDGDLSGLVQHAVGKVLGELRKKRGVATPPVATTEEAPADVSPAEEPVAEQPVAEMPPPVPIAPQVDRPYWEALEVEKRGFARVHIPEPLRRKVWKRAGGVCQGILPNGKRCHSPWQCEIDHIEPVARGGPTTLENLRVLCRRCNQEEERRVFGDDFVDRQIRAKKGRKDGPDA